MGIVQNLRGKVRGREDESCEIESAAWRNLLRVRVRWRRVAFWFSALDRHLESSSRKINNARSETSQNSKRPREFQFSFVKTRHTVRIQTGQF